MIMNMFKLEDIQLLVIDLFSFIHVLLKNIDNFPTWSFFTKTHFTLFSIGFDISYKYYSVFSLT